MAPRLIELLYTSSSEKLLEHKGEEVALVLVGKVKVYLDDEEYILEPGG